MTIFARSATHGELGSDHDHLVHAIVEAGCEACHQVFLVRRLCLAWHVCVWWPWGAVIAMGMCTLGCYQVGIYQGTL